MADGGLIAALASRIKSGTPVFAAWCGLPEPLVAESLVRAGFDTAVFDMQHGTYDFAAVLRGIDAVALAGKPAMVRIPVGEFALVSRLFDAGAAAVVAPMINSVADATAFAAFAKFPPMGERSWGPHRAMALSGLQPQAYLAQANAIHLAIAMIETREALAALDDILAVPGIDGVLVGPSDLSIALSHGEKLDPGSADVDAALTHIVARAKAHGKFAALFTLSGAKAREMAARGYALCSIATDQILLRAAAQAELAAARP